MDARPVLGRSGEDAAVAFLKKRGYSIVERNFRSRTGEIDIVARDGRTVVFCEVKARKTDRWGDPSEAVHPKKQRRLRVLAVEWLRARGAAASEVRFDVVSVIVRDGRTEIRHIRAAF